MATNFQFDGITKDYIRITEMERPFWYSLERNLDSVPNRIGERLRDTDVDALTIPVTIRIEAESRDQLFDRTEEMADWLVTEQEKELIFNDRKNRRYFALVDGDFEPEMHIGLFAIMKFEFICPDPRKYGEPQKTIAQKKFTWESVEGQTWEETTNEYDD